MLLKVLVIRSSNDPHNGPYLGLDYACKIFLLDDGYPNRLMLPSKYVTLTIDVKLQAGIRINRTI